MMNWYINYQDLAIQEQVYLAQFERKRQELFFYLNTPAPASMQEIATCIYNLQSWQQVFASFQYCAQYLSNFGLYTLSMQLALVQHNLYTVIAFQQQRYQAALQAQGQMTWASQYSPYVPYTPPVATYTPPAINQSSETTDDKIAALLENINRSNKAFDKQMKGYFDRVEGNCPVCGACLGTYAVCPSCAYDLKRMAQQF